MIEEIVIDNSHGKIFVGTKGTFVCIAQGYNLIAIHPASIDALIAALQQIKTNLTTK